jgi:hypothetical protein
MPAWGLIPDSPWITAGLKARNALRRGGGRGGRISTTTVITVTGLVLYKPILNYELNVPSGMVGRHMLKIGTQIKVAAQRQVGVKSGRLRASIKVEQKTTGTRQHVKVGSSLHYALMHHEGTRPHMITPNPPKTHLRFTNKRGGMVYTTSVMHPGTKPNRYLSSQLRKFVR